MIIRTNTITTADLYRTLHDVEPLLDLDAEQRASRTHTRGFKVSLTYLGNKEKGDGRYRKNPGQGGGNFAQPWAATHDEWGEWLARLFDLDPGATMTYYRNRDDFHEQTDGKYRLAAPEPAGGRRR